jgi:FkbM family methyltransferase
MNNPVRNYEVLVQETYETVLRRGDIAVDVGAHQGRHCIGMAEKVFPDGKVLAFEPLPMCREVIAKELQEYDADLARILTVYPFALSDRSGTTEFVVAKDALAYSGLKERQYDWPTQLERIPIEVRRLDDLCQALPSLRYLKIDAEGGEYHILKGAEQTLQRCRPVVAFEFGANSIAAYGITVAEMARFWSEQNYKVFGITGMPLSETDLEVYAAMQIFWDYVAVPAEDSALQRTVANVLGRPPGWERVTVHLDATEHNLSRLGIPPSLGIHGIKRWLAQRAAALITYATRVVIAPQRASLRSLMRSLRALLHILRDQERAAAWHSARVAELASAVDALSQRLQLQQDQLTCQAEQLAHREAQLVELTRAVSLLSKEMQPGAPNQAA